MHHIVLCSNTQKLHSVQEVLQSRGTPRDISRGISRDNVIVRVVEEAVRAAVGTVTH